MSVYNQLYKNSFSPSNAAASGGSFGMPSMEGNTLMDMFSPGSRMHGMTTPILDPWAGKERSRFEVPDTSQVVNLGEIVMFTMQSNNENFLTREILPIVSWGWAVKTFAWSVWNFPQVPIRPTPETAPPRFLSSSKLSETSELMRFSIGQHGSNEYFKTNMGIANQGYNLQQIELSVQESLNNLCVKALHNAQYQHRARMEQISPYKVTDVEKLMRDEVSQFAMTVKKTHGFKILFETISTEIGNGGGSVTAAILTKRLNTIVLTKPELTEYYRAGPAGPALVSSPNRSFMDNGVKVYWTQTFPERFGTETSGQWQRLSQIGNYHKSLELSNIRSNSKYYMENYNSFMRDITIYDQENDAMSRIKVEDMLKESKMFDYQGNLCAIDAPPISKAKKYEDNNGESDFLSFDNQVVHTPKTISETLGASQPKHPSYGQNKSHRPSAKTTSPKTLEVFGQLRNEDFTHVDIKETGEMIVCRLAKDFKLTSDDFSTNISAGLRLYKQMCSREVDVDFLDFVFKSHMKKMYQNEYQSLSTASAYPDDRGQASELWVDVGSDNIEDVRNKATSIFVQPGTSARPYDSLISAHSPSGCLPLPLDNIEDFPEYKGKYFGNLSGYASYPGFEAMSKAYKSNHNIASTRYNIEELRIATNFVDTVEHVGNKISDFLPGCQCFDDPGDKTYGEIISEQLMNMVGFPVWVDVNDVNLVIVSTGEISREGEGETGDEYMSGGDVGGSKKSKSKLENDLNDMRGDDVTAKLTGFSDIYKLFEKGLFENYYAGGGKDVDVLAGFNAVKKSIRKMKNVGEILKEILGDGINIEDKPSIDGALKMSIKAYDLKNEASIVSLLDKWTNIGVTGTIGSKYGYHQEITNFEGTVEDAMGRISNESFGLAISSPNAILTVLTLMGPLRLQMISCVLEAAVGVFLSYNDIMKAESGTEKYRRDYNIVKKILELNLLMMPNLKIEYSESKGSSSDDSSYIWTVNPRLDEISNIRNELYRKDIEFEKSILLGSFVGAMRSTLQNVSTVRYNNIIEQIKEAKGDELDWNDNGHVISPILEGLPFTVKYPKIGESLNMPIGEYVASLLFSNEASLLKNLGYIRGEIKGDNFEKFGVPILKDIRIATGLVGSRQGQRKGEFESKKTTHSISQIGGRDRQGQNRSTPYTKPIIFSRPSGNYRSGEFRPTKIPNYSEDESSFHLPENPYDNYYGNSNFVKTGLIIASEQLESFSSKTNKSNQGKNFHLRISSPEKPHTAMDKGEEKTLSIVASDRQKSFRMMTSNHRAISPSSLGQISDWSEVPYLTADQRLKNTFFGPSSKENGFDLSIPGLRIKANLTYSFVNHCQFLDGCSQDISKYMALLWMCTPFNESSCLATLENNIRLPVNFLIFRPHMNYLMESCALVNPGIDTLGFTAIAGKDYAWGSTAITKEFVGHLSFWSNVIITSPQNCKIVRNLMSVSYGPGGGVGWFDPDKYDVKKLGGFKPPLNGSLSLMCVPVPFTFNAVREYISIGGRLQHTENGYGGSNSIIKGLGNTDNHYPTSTRANAIWGWRGHADSNYMDMVGANGQFPLFNGITYPGMTFYSSTPTKDEPNGSLSFMTINKGHWGHQQGPGCKAVYNGEVEPLPDFGYQTSGRYTVVP